MDLALNLSWPSVAVGARGMSEREFVRWQHYASKRMLPWRRMECYLAQIAQKIAQTMGGATQATIDDYLFQTPEEPPNDDDDDTLQAAIEAFDFKPRNAKG